jgi:hypothetical protein
MNSQVPDIKEFPSVELEGTGQEPILVPQPVERVRNLKLNQFVICGEVAIFFANHAGGEVEFLVDVADVGNVRAVGRRWCVAAREDTSYVFATIEGRYVFLHRFLVGCGRDMHVDHKNHNGLDNRRCNLRPTNRFINALNRRGPSRGNASGFLGVRWRNDMGKWRAQLEHKRQKIYLGYFDNPEEAGRVVSEKRAEIMREAGHVA